MIVDYATDLAMQMDIKLSRVSIVEGNTLGYPESSLVHLYSNRQMVSAIIYQPELEDLQNRISSDRVDVKLRAALSRLKLLLEP